MKKWRCKLCGYVYEGEEPPRRAPYAGRRHRSSSSSKTNSVFATEEGTGHRGFPVTRLH